MPSIQARTYPVSAMLPSTVPLPAATNTTKTPAQKTDTVAPSDAARSVSDRVSAFLTSDTTTEKTTQRPKGPPPPPPGGAGGPQGAGQSEATSESETALLLLEEAEAEYDADEVDEDTATQTTAVLFDEAKNYYPTSIY